jgi:hypothetical protein
LIEAQRAAGEALAGTLNEQLNLSALLPALPAAKAALEALMQTTNSAAAAISIVNLMARSSLNCRDLSAFPPDPITKSERAKAVKSARSLHKNMSAQCTTMPR